MFETIVGVEGQSSVHTLDFLADGTLEDVDRALAERSINLQRVLSLTCKLPEADSGEQTSCVRWRVIYESRSVCLG